MMMLKTMKISDYVAEIWNGRQHFNINIDYTITDDPVVHTYTIAGEEFIKYVLYNYTSYSYTYLTELYSPITENAYTIFKDNFDSWMMSHYHSLSRIVGTMLTEYGALENFDRKETYSDTETHSGVIEVKRIYSGEDIHEYQDQQNSKDEYSKTGSDINTTTYNSTTTDRFDNTSTLTFTERSKTHLVSAYDDSNDVFRNKDKDVDNGSESTHNYTADGGTGDTSAKTGSDTNTNTFDNYKETTDYKKHYKDTRKFDNYEEKTTEDRTKDTHVNAHNGHLHGNIGLTTSQSMAVNEISFRMRFHVVPLIARSFACECLILI